jgi:hypothetical protein
MASADSKPPIVFVPLTRDERTRIMEMVPEKITDEKYKQLEKLTTRPVGLRHKGLVNALNHLKPILLEDHRPDDFYNIEILTRVLNKGLPLGINIQNAINAYNSGFTHLDAYSESHTPIKSFYETHTDLTPIQPEVISAFSLDNFEIFAHKYQQALELSIENWRRKGEKSRDGGRNGKSRSSKKRSRRLRHKSATKSRRPRRRRSNRRTSRK